MDKNQYLAQKKLRSQLQEHIYSQQRNLCLKCLKSMKACLCSYIRPFFTKAEFIFLMHPKEAKKEKVGTGRMTQLCLQNSRLIIGEKFGQADEVAGLLKDSGRQNLVLYPGPRSLNLSEQDYPLEWAGSPKRIFIIDGTWHEAKSMMRESCALHPIPRISFSSAYRSRFSIKQQPSGLCLSTAESVYYLLNELHKRGHESLNQNQHHQLLDHLKRMVDYQIACSKDPTRSSYRAGEWKSPEQRKPSKKWSQRKICYQDRPKCPQ